jgi:hypothetical protein
MPYFDSNALVNGDGASVATPYNVLPSLALGSADWYFAAGSVLALGASQLTTGNNASIRKYGTGLDPLITSTGSAFSCSTASGNVVLEDLSITRIGGQGGEGINCSQMAQATGSFTLRRCLVGGFNTLLRGDKTNRVTVEYCDLMGSATTFGIRGIAQEASGTARNCDDWLIQRNNFDCGVDIYLFTSDAANTAGRFDNLRILYNRMVAQFDLAGTSIYMGSPLHATNYGATASIVSNVLIRDGASPVWPAWAPGQVLFLAGWSNRANFGTVTVVSGGGTRNVTVTNLDATLVNESAGIGKGVFLRDPARAFIGPRIEGNVIGNRGETPIFPIGLYGGVIKGNRITDCTINPGGTIAAAIELQGCIGTKTTENIIQRIYSPTAVDAMGIFVDGACDLCEVESNYITDIPGSEQDNSGAALAVFFARHTSMTANVGLRCKRGYWQGGTGTGPVTLDRNTLADNDIGIRSNSQPAAGTLTARNNLLISNAVALDEDGGGTINHNWYWDNAVNNANGLLSAEDSNALTTNPQLDAQYRPIGGSPVLTSGIDLGPWRDADRRSGTNTGMGAYATPAARAALRDWGAVIPVGSPAAGALVAGTPFVGLLGSEILEATGDGTHGAGIFVPWTPEPGKRYKALVVSLTGGPLRLDEFGAGEADAPFAAILNVYEDNILVAEGITFTGVFAASVHGSANGAVAALTLLPAYGTASGSTTAVVHGMASGILSPVAIEAATGSASGSVVLPESLPSVLGMVFEILI